MPRSMDSNGISNSSGPVYISVHSAHVILSDIRDTNLKSDALAAINAFLDELLWKILNVSASLATGKLKASLLKVLPTSLGKDALLEAEVELRAYWERTNATSASSPARLADDEKDFSLEWAFELLRLKCQAYSTLNDSDEDTEAESRLNKRMAESGKLNAPKAILVAPAALYLTAILESICEHVLTNVGRVTARDSAKDTATVQDLFTALCEDESIYSLFRSMRVYETIEQTTKPPKIRRSKSFSRSNESRGGAPSRTGSPIQYDPSARTSSPSAVQRASSESSGSNTSTLLGHGITNSPGSRPSIEKARAIKMFGSHHRGSSDSKPAPSGGVLGDSPALYRKMDSSIGTEAAKHGAIAGVGEPLVDEDDMDFDDVMQSGATMKVSLTPDRLRTMEINKERNKRESILSPMSGSPLEPTIALDKEELSSSRRGHHGRPPLRHHDSIIEDEEETTVTSPSRSEPAAMNQLPPPPPSPVRSPPAMSMSNRIRSLSTASHSGAAKMRNLSRKASLGLVPSPPMSPPEPVPPPMFMSPPSERRLPAQLDTSKGWPERKRKIQRSPEAMDLDEIMNGSDEEGELDAPLPSSVPKTPKTPKTPNGTPAVSARTRDLMDFLSEGPPDVPSMPSMHKSPSMVSIETTKSVRVGGLRRMVSKLTKGGSNERPNSAASDGRLREGSAGAKLGASHGSFSQISLQEHKMYPNVIVATRPPRPPPSSASSFISPPSSPSMSDDLPPTPGSESRHSTLSRRTGTMERVDESEVPLPLSVPLRTETASVRTMSSGTSATYTTSNGRPGHTPSREPSDSSEGASKVKTVRAPNGKSLPSSPREGNASPVSKPVRERSSSKLGGSAGGVETPSESIKTFSSLHADDTGELRRMLSNATTADECRLLVDMFLARSGFPLGAESAQPPLSLPLAPPPSDPAVESSLVELLLGDTESAEEEPANAEDAYDAIAPMSPPASSNIPTTQNGKVPHKIYHHTSSEDASKRILTTPAIRMEA